MRDMINAYINLPRQVHILCAGQLLNRAGTLLVPFVTLYLKNKLGLSTVFATSVVGAFGVGAIIASLLGGHLADRIGRKPVMIFSLVGSGLLIMIFGQLRAPAAILIGAASISLIGDLYRPAAQAMIADLVPPAMRPQAYTLVYLAINLGFAIAPLLGGFLAEINYQLLFVVDAATAAAYGLVILFLIRETLPSRLKTFDPAGTAQRSAQSASMAEALRHILTDRVFLAFCISAATMGVIFFQSLSTLPLYLEARHGIDAAGYGMIVAWNGILIVVFQLPVTAFVARRNRAAVMVASCSLIGIGFGGTVLASSVAGFILTVVIWTFGEMLQMPLMSTIVADLAPANMRARYMGFFGMAFSGGRTFGGPAGGLVLEAWGGNVLWIGCLILGLTAASLFALTHRTLNAAVDGGTTHDEAPTAPLEPAILEAVEAN